MHLEGGRRMGSGTALSANTENGQIPSGSNEGSGLACLLGEVADDRITEDGLPDLRDKRCCNNGLIPVMRPR